MRNTQPDLFDSVPGVEELERQVEERTLELKTHQIELEMQNEELRVAQEELETSRTKYADLYDFAPVGYFMLDTNGLIKEVNLAGVNLLGINKQALLNKPFSLFIDEPGDGHAFAEHKKRALATKKLQACELKLRRNNGSFFYARLESIPSGNVDDKAGYIRTAVSDITERKQIEQALQESEEKYRTLFENMTASFALSEIILDDAGKPRDYRCREVNKAYEKLSGIPREKIMSKTALERNPLLEPSWLEKFGAVARTGEPLLFEHYIGHLGKWLEVYAYSPKRGLFACVINDITERKRAEQALRKSEERFRQLADCIDPFFALNKDFRFTFWNRASEKNTGMPAHAIMGKFLFDVFPELKGTRLEQTYREVVATGQARFLENRWDRPGRVTYHDVSVYPTADGIAVFSRDVTDRKQAENIISRQNAIMEGINTIFQSALTCDTEEEPGRACLEVAEGVTQSKFGFVGAIDSDGFIRNIAISNPGWEACTMNDKTGHRRSPGNFKVHGLYGRALTDGKCFFTNDPASHPDSIGLPEGHPPLTAFLGAPLIHMGKAIGIVGLGNREGGYRTEDAEAMDALSVVMVQVFQTMRAEEALRKNQERLREYVNLLEYAPLVVHNMKEEIILWNRGMERMYGYSSAEAIGQNSHQLLKTQFPGTLEDILRTVETTGKWEGEMKHVTRDGRTIIVTSIWVLHKNSEGKATAIIEVNSDITERRRAEEQLQKLNEELEARVRERTFDLARTITTLQNEIVDRRQAEEALRESQFNLSKAQSIAHIGSWSYDLQTEKFVSSVEFYNIFGLKSDDKADLRTIVKIVHPDDREKVRTAIRELMSTFKAKPLDYRIILLDGATRVVWTEAEMLFDAAHRPVSVVGTVHDITERKRSEEELIRLATAVESAADALVVTDPVKGIILYVNPAFEKITGYARQEAVGRDLHMLESGRHDEEFFQKLRETLRQDGVWTGRMVHKKKDGTLYHEECTYSPVKNASGEIINYISIKRDVTEKVRLESIAQAVETMNNIGYIFAGVSHEIGNPINAIRMTLDIMQKKLNTLRKENIAEYLDRVMSQVFRVEYLLKGLKNFNMYESLQPSVIKLSSFLDGFLSMVKKDFEAKGILIETVLQQDAACVYADPRALQQVLLNILTNASDALEGREDPKIAIAISASSGLVKIQVKDNGRGIEKSKLKDLFKPFYTTKKHGTGLGLVIIKKMIARMNGTVEITSCSNEGTTVEICLPIEKNGES